MPNIPEISLPAEPVINLGPIHITNSVLASFVVTLILTIFALAVRKRIGLIPSRIQVAAELFLGIFMKLLTDAYGSEKRARKYLPFILTLFFFILISNQFGVFPLINDIVAGEGTKFLRTPTSDLAITLTMGLTVVISSHIIAFSMSPIRHIGRFINIGGMLKARSVKGFLQGFLDFFLGFLDIIGELAKIVSISARLFGNIFAGEVMIVIIASLASFTQFVVPLPFMVLSAFSGVIQAFVFAILALNFMSGNIRAMDPVESETASSSSHS